MKTLSCALLLCSSAALARPDAWVYVRDADTTSMHGDRGDLAAARRHLGDLGPGYLWFRAGGREYALRDAKILKEVDDLLVQQADLGAAQGRLGKEQGRLGGEQARLGAEQARASLEGAQQERSQAQRELGRAQSKLGEQQAELGREQQRLARELQRRIDAAIETSLKDGSAKAL